MNRHKTNWDRVMAAIDSVKGNAEAVAVLRQELAPKYALIVARREKARASAAAYRRTERGRAAKAAYAKKYRAENREKCNAASRDWHRLHRAKREAK